MILQVLQSMPVVAAPPRVVQPAPWPAAEEEQEALVVPGQALLLPLQPSKLGVYNMFTQQVGSHLLLLQSMVNERLHPWLWFQTLLCTAPTLPSLEKQA